MRTLLSSLALTGLFASSASARLLVDFNSTNQDGPAHNEQDYKAYDGAHENPASLGVRNYNVDFPELGPATVSVTPAWPNTTDARVQQVIDRDAALFDANWVGDKIALLTDFLGTDTRPSNGGNGNYDGTNGTPTWLTLTLGGLPAGYYSWLSYHHDVENVHSEFTIELSTDAGATFTEVFKGQMTDSTAGGLPASPNPIDGSLDPDPRNLPSTARFGITANGSDVVLRFTPLSSPSGVHQQILGINGFELAGFAPWNPTGAILLPRGRHTATLLPDGKVIVVGGSNVSNPRAIAELYDPGAGTWSTPDPLAIVRDNHTATLLPTGKVLVAGGSDGGTPLAAVELYDPASGNWSALDPLATARSSHTSTLLRNGKVLVAGGSDGSNALAGAELYDPVTGNWSATGDLVTGRSVHTATLLPDGKVLVAGGSDGSNRLGSAELYDPASGTWSATGSLATPRNQHTTTALADGRVLVAGGSGSSVDFLSSAELYDPDGNGGLGSWSPAGSLATARRTHTATLLPDGSVLFAGGWDGTSLTRNVELYDPATGTFSITSPLSAGRDFHTATLLPGGKVLVAGGDWVSRVELYDPASGGWSATGALADARIDHTATLLPDGRVLIAGGSDGNVDLVSAELYDPLTNDWSTTGSLATSRRQHTATLLPDGKVLVVGGRIGLSLPIASAELYDPTSGIWSVVNSLADGRFRHTATLLPDGKVLVAGGFGNSLLASPRTELYDPTSGTWNTTGSLAENRYDHTATLLPNGNVFVAGGFGISGTFDSVAIYQSATGTWASTFSPATPRTRHTATSLPDGGVLLAGGSAAGSPIDSALRYTVDFGWPSPGSLATARTNHTATLLTSGSVLVTGGSDGSNSLADAELYDPASGISTSTGGLADPRHDHTATLLSDGRVLVVGGSDGTNALATAELYENGLGFLPARQPQIATASLDNATGILTLTGSGFRGTSGGSGGGAADSPTDYPLVQLRRVDSGQTTFLNPAPSGGFSADEFTSAPLTPFVGHALVTVFANGIPSAASVVLSELSFTRDFDGDGLSDAAEVQGAALGFDLLESQVALVGAFRATAGVAGFYDQGQYDANRQAGRDDVTSDPNPLGLYTLGQVQALHAPAPLLARDPGTGTFCLTMDWMKSTDLVTFFDFPAAAPEVSVNPQGDIEFKFDSPDNAAFFRVEVE